MKIVTDKYSQLIRDDDDVAVCKIKPVCPGGSLLEVALFDGGTGLDTVYYYSRDDLNALSKFFQEFLS